MRRVVPRHVAACQHSACQHERWYVWTWKKNLPELQTRIPYSCNSWRCDVCRRHEAAVTFARLKEATERPELDPSGWCFFVLTLDRNGVFADKKPDWLTARDAYGQVGKMTTKFLTRIGRRWGADTKVHTRKNGTVRTERTVGRNWACVVEAHRSGWPHINLVVWCPELAAELRRDQQSRLEDPEIANAVALSRDAWANKQPVPHAVRELARKASLLGDEVLSCATDSGWGRQSTGEAARDVHAVASYLVKLVGEVAKTTQAPLNAPVRFRRLRTGKGFLPPRRTNPDVTGCLTRRRRSAQGDWEVLRVNAPKDPEQLAAVEQAARAEFQLIEEEERILARMRRLPAMPPLRIAIAGRLEGHLQTSERKWAQSRRAVQSA